MPGTGLAHAIAVAGKITTLDEIDPHLRGIHYQQHNVQLTTLTGPYPRHHLPQVT